MFTGDDEVNKFGEINNWNGSNKLDYFPSHCGMLNGSAGELFPPHLDKTSVSIFSTDLCR